MTPELQKKINAMLELIGAASTTLWAHGYRVDDLDDAKNSIGEIIKLNKKLEALLQKTIDLTESKYGFISLGATEGFKAKLKKAGIKFNYKGAEL